MLSFLIQQAADMAVEACATYSGVENLLSVDMDGGRMSRGGWNDWSVRRFSRVTSTGRLHHHLDSHEFPLQQQRCGHRLQYVQCAHCSIARADLHEHDHYQHLTHTAYLPLQHAPSPPRRHAGTTRPRSTQQKYRTSMPWPRHGGTPTAPLDSSTS